MRVVRLLLEYDGTAYAGWQRQSNAPSIQGVLEHAAHTLLQESVRVIGAGRTDAGVHALGQVAHFTTTSRLSAGRIRNGLAALLPDDIAVHEASDAAPEFHARRDARLRIYRYVVLTRRQPSALLRRYTHHLPEPLELDAMTAAATALEGRHDFAAYGVAGVATPTTVCNMTAVHVGRHDDLVVVTVAADRFLRQMVRMIVGTLLRVGRGMIPPEATAVILESGDKRQAGPAAPAHGLYLVRVLYEGDLL